jgi:hypothetical protein
MGNEPFASGLTRAEARFSSGRSDLDLFFTLLKQRALDPSAHTWQADYFTVAG